MDRDKTDYERKDDFIGRPCKGMMNIHLSLSVLFQYLHMLIQLA